MKIHKLHEITSNYINVTSNYMKLHQVTLNYIKLHYTKLQQVALH